MHVDRECLAWAAGFFEGEGSIRLNTYSKKKQRHYYTVTLDAVQVNREPLERFAAALSGLGKIYGPYLHSGDGKRQEHYRFIIHSFERAQAAVAMLWPWISARRKEQARRALESYRELTNRPKLKSGPKPRQVAA